MARIEQLRDEYPINLLKTIAAEQTRFEFNADEITEDKLDGLAHIIASLSERVGIRHLPRANAMKSTLPCGINLLSQMKSEIPRMKSLRRCVDFIQPKTTFSISSAFADFITK